MFGQIDEDGKLVGWQSNHPMSVQAVKYLLHDISWKG